MPTSDDINVKFIINGIVIKDFKRQIGNRPASGYIDLGADYYVPMNAAEPFDFNVILDNGSQARITIPLIRWDVGISPGEMYWTGETVAVPGKNIFLRTKIKNNTFLKFPFDFNKIAYRVLIDGEIFYEMICSCFWILIFPLSPHIKSLQAVLHRFNIPLFWTHMDSYMNLMRQIILLLLPFQLKTMV